MSTPAGWYNDPDNDNFVRWWDGQRWTHHTDLKKNEELNIVNEFKEPPYDYSSKPKRPTRPFNVRHLASGMVMPGIHIDQTSRDVVDVPSTNPVEAIPSLKMRLPSFRHKQDQVLKFKLRILAYQDGQYDVAITHHNKTVGYLTDHWLALYIPFLLKLESEGRDVYVDGKEYNTLGGKNVMIFMPKPEEFAMWVDAPAHLRRSRPPKLEESGAYIQNVDDNTDDVLALLGNRPSYHGTASFEVVPILSGQHAGSYVIHVITDNIVLGSVSPWHQEQFHSFFHMVTIEGIRSGRIYIDRMGKQSAMNHRGLRIIAFVPMNFS